METAEFNNLVPEYEMYKTGFQTAGRECLKLWRRGQIAVMQKESIHSIVTEADLKSQGILVDWIKQLHPDAKIVSEEMENEEPGSDFWIFDPLDGTSHFERGLDGWSISGGRISNGEVVVGMTYAPVSGDFFFAEKGKGAYFNGQKMSVSATEQLKDGIINVGHRTVREDNEGKIKDLLNSTRSMFVTGSTALALANLAAGRLDVALHENQSFWDIAAGSLMIREAGGQFTNRQGSQDFDMSGKKATQNCIIATNGLLHQAVSDRLAA